MLRITIELLPLGSEENKETIGLMNIWNDATGTKVWGNYQYKIFKKNEPTEIWLRGFVRSFPRKKLNVWDLLFRALFHAVGDRNMVNKIDTTE